MTNVRHDCPDGSCDNRGYFPPGNPDNYRCVRHDELMVQTEFGGQAIEDVAKYAEPSVLMQTPTSIDASPHGMTGTIGDVQGDHVSQLPMKDKLANPVSSEEIDRIQSDMLTTPGRFDAENERADANRAERQAEYDAKLAGEDQDDEGDDEVSPDSYEDVDRDDEGLGASENTDPGEYPDDDDLDGWRRLYAERQPGEADRRWGVPRIKSELGVEQ